MESVCGVIRIDIKENTKILSNSDNGYVGSIFLLVILVA